MRIRRAARDRMTPDIAFSGPLGCSARVASRSAASLLATPTRNLPVRASVCGRGRDAILPLSSTVRQHARGYAK
jgi:hypothetical protein